MNKTTERAKTIYDRYRFGQFSYAGKRPGFHPTLMSILESCTPDQKVCDIGCGRGFWMYLLADMGVVPKSNIVCVDIAPETFVEAVREHEPDIVGMSALLTTTMTSMKGVVEALEEAGLRGAVRVIIGGAPVTDAFAKEIGADGYAPDAASAVDLARSLMG